MDSADYSQATVSYQSFFVTPYFWNIFHLSAILEKNQIFNTHFSYSNFKIPFLLDRDNKTPLHFLAIHAILDHPSINFMLDYIVDYLSDKAARNYYEVEQIQKSLSGLFHFIISEMSPKTKNKYLKLCLGPCLSSTPLPQFGENKTRSAFTKITTIQPSVQKRIHKPGQDRITFSNTMVRLDYDITSDDMFGTAVILSSVTDENTFKTPFVTKVVDHIWKETRPAVIVSSTFFSALMALFSVYIGLGRGALGLGVLIVLLACIALAGEAVKFNALRERYTLNALNWMNTINLLLIVLYIAARMTSNSNSLIQSGMLSLAILTGCLCLISFLRYFKATSKLNFNLNRNTKTY